MNGRRRTFRSLAKRNERENVLKELLQISTLEFNHEIRAALENLTLGEIVKVSERAKIHMYSLKEETSEAIKAAIKATPTAGKKIQKPTDEKSVTFSSIGGLKKVKKQLTEIFLWPSKYANLYQKCGLRICGGAILYGPTGCGKTLIARAISYESKFNVITVKGPELLSKYIGASEQNVRDVFERARATKPALIIFDEFDALAPKRGHDSTGVTDRVVNQLLTELDGVESTNDGIYILAATNRMDLIDSALLRPGRFDHKVFVDFPDFNEREEILLKICDEIEISENVNFKELAKVTEGWTGADLRGLVINASFAAADDNPNSNDSPKIEMNHFKSAINEKNKKQSQKQQQKNQKQQVSSRVTLA
uniref:AAA+ ATPase domain-containing protein n=1 Tax=Panagrolaimus sp. PS1159 TaxID=55785 RepID=A0AC35FJV8_9BILA